MNLGQSILAAAALILLTVLVISANRMIILSQQDEYRSIAANAASEIANAIMNEALSKKFDAKSTTMYYQDSTEFTTRGNLGPEGTEPHFTILNPDTVTATSTFKSLSLYNDFDDYNGYVRKVDTPTMKGFIATCKVYYAYIWSNNMNVATTDISGISIYRSYFKCIVVTIQLPTFVSYSDQPPISYTYSAVKTY